MRSKWVYSLTAILVAILAGSLFGQTEDEIIAKYLKKTEVRNSNRIGYVVVTGCYGRLGTGNDYNRFGEDLSRFVTGLNGSYDHIDGIFRSKEFYAGLGMITSSRTALEAGLTYWMKMGNSPQGDYNLSLAFPDDTSDHLGMQLKSEVQVYGFSGNFAYYVTNPPDKSGLLRSLAIKTNLGAGYYFANWQLWDGFNTFNLSTQDYEPLDGKLTGTAPGFTVGMTLELPVGFGGLVMEGGARYQYLNFANMKWYNSKSEENVVTYNGTTERVKLDLSGPRAQFGLKRYIAW